MIDRCANCPADPARDCLAQRSRNRRYCELVDPASPHYRPAYVPLLAAAPESPAIPGLIERAVSFAGAVVEHVATGMHRATPEQVEARLAICRECEFYDAERVRCRKCGCGLAGDLLGKATWAEQSCPVGKWGPVEPGEATPTASPVP